MGLEEASVWRHTRYQTDDPELSDACEKKKGIWFNGLTPQPTPLDLNSLDFVCVFFLEEGQRHILLSPVCGKHVVD